MTEYFLGQLKFKRFQVIFFLMNIFHLSTKQGCDCIENYT